MKVRFRETEKTLTETTKVIKITSKSKRYRNYFIISSILFTISLTANILQGIK